MPAGACHGGDLKLEMNFGMGRQTCTGRHAMLGCQTMEPSFTACTVSGLAMHAHHAAGRMTSSCTAERLGCRAQILASTPMTMAMSRRQTQDAHLDFKLCWRQLEALSCPKCYQAELQQRCLGLARHAALQQAASFCQPRALALCLQVLHTGITSDACRTALEGLPCGLWHCMGFPHASSCKGAVLAAQYDCMAVCSSDAGLL